VPLSAVAVERRDVEVGGEKKRGGHGENFTDRNPLGKR